MIDNYFETAPREGLVDDEVGLLFRICCTERTQDSLNLLLERNTIKTSGFGLAFINFGALINSAIIDAGWAWRAASKSSFRHDVAALCCDVVLVTFLNQ